MVFLNGEFLPIEKATVPVLDRGFIFGDGVYELIPVYSRVPFRLDEHLARLERSLGDAKIRNPFTRARMERALYGLIARSRRRPGRLPPGHARRGEARSRVPEGRRADGVHDVQSAGQPAARERSSSGAAAVTALDYRWLSCDIKSISLLGNCLLRQLSAEAGAVESILFRDGYLTEASASQRVRREARRDPSPPKTNLILPGITYDVVVELARANGLPLELRAITRSRSARRRRDLGHLVDEGSAGGRRRSTASASAAASPGPVSAACTSSTRSSSRR